MKRAFSSARSLRYAEQQSPEEILEKGFRQMESGKYKKSEEQLQPMLDAAKQLGVSQDEVKRLYADVQVGAVPYDKMSLEQRQQADQEEVEALAPPTLDEPFKFDDLPPLGHLLLHEHRVQREYNRIAAYQLPQLAQFAKPYVPPKKGDVLRFKYTTYMGEAHPGDKKVTVSFKTRDLALSDAERHKLRVLAGTRYNAGTDEVRISADRFPEQAQNKRFLGEIVENLIKHAKDQSDAMADVPVDTRHVEPKLRRNKPIYPQHQFPKEWERPQDAPKPKTDIFSAIARQVEQN
jgi:small subunit ribosomal protein S35